MCFPSKTDKLIASVMRINSPYKNIGKLVPKMVYFNGDEDVSGVLYDPDRDQLIHADIENGVILESYDVVPTHIEYPDADGNYKYSNEELLELHDCQWCGEADDLSCYVYFDCVDSEED